MTENSKWYHENKEQLKAYYQQRYQDKKEELKTWQKQFWTEEGIGIYAWKDVVEDKIVYVGSGYLKQRKRCTTNKTAVSRALAELFEQNGTERYEFIELEKCGGDKTELKMIEQRWINQLNPICNKNKTIRTKDEDREYRNRKWREMYHRRKLSE